MAFFSALDVLKMTPKTNMDAEFDSMVIPHWSNYLTIFDIENLRKIATSKRYAGNMNLKYKMIDNIMKSRGFLRFAGGTNRVVYKYLEDNRFLVKVAVDSVGMSDNPSEFYNQNLLKPYCAKMFWVTDCGTVGFAERLLPITSINEFKLVADCIFDILYYKIIGKYIIEDIGTKYFMNWGIRKNFGPCLLDYPYLFELDGAKLMCKTIMPDKSFCGGEIDYDDGFNELVCLRCGRRYGASELRKNVSSNSIIINKGGNIPMNVKIIKDGQILAHNNSSDFIRKPQAKARVVSNKEIKVSIVKADSVISKVENGIVITGTNEEKKPEEVVVDTVFDTCADIVEENNDASIEDVNEKIHEPEEVNDSSEESYSQIPEVEEEDISQVNEETEDIADEGADYYKFEAANIPDGVPSPVKNHVITKSNSPISNANSARIVSDASGRRVIGTGKITLNSQFITEDSGDY